ncbi:hypothetical protein J1N35_028901 [Gossypium stocksii]|uniref:Uncharacterized protein n=1 Tax=Gossypium stocksii TaxID=47602 RepID=A0A9D3UXS3_9ROSI|nr:hypothetical protein J1N35_028901 [Gossypium stocksii]
MASIANFEAMRNIIANLWHLLGGIHNLPIGLMSESMGHDPERFKEFHKNTSSIRCLCSPQKTKKTTWPWEKLMPYVDYSWKKLARNGLGSIIKGQTLTSINDYGLLTLR